MVNREAKIAIIFAERALLDTDSKVRNGPSTTKSGCKCGRAKQIIIASTRHPNPEIRRNCIEMLDRILVEEEQRELAEDLLKTEKDEEIKKILRKLLIDISLEGTEAEKNRFLAPAEPVPAIDREVASAMGQAIGLLDENGNLRTTLPSAKIQTNRDSINISRIPKEDQKHIKKARPTFNGVPIEDIDDDDDDFEDMYDNHYPEYIYQAVSIKEWSLVGRLQGVDTMSGAFNDKEEQFDRLWDGITQRELTEQRHSSSDNTFLSMLDKHADHLLVLTQRSIDGSTQKEIKESESF